MENILKSLSKSSRVVLNGDFAVLYLDGQGALAIPGVDYNQATIWAKSKISSGNKHRDMAAFLNQLSVYIVKAGTQMCQTTGNAKYLSDLMRSMKQAGFELDQWSIPKALLTTKTVQTNSPSAVKARVSLKKPMPTSVDDYLDGINQHSRDDSADLEQLASMKRHHERQQRRDAFLRQTR